MERSWSGGLLAAAMTYFLFLQGLTGAIAQGTVAGAVTDPSFVICSSMSSHGGTGDPSEGPGDDDHQFCGILCQLAGIRIASLSGSPPGLDRLELFHEVVATDLAVTPVRQRVRSHVAEARAPPQAS